MKNQAAVVTVISRAIAERTRKDRIVASSRLPNLAPERKMTGYEQRNDFQTFY